MEKWKADDWFVSHYNYADEVRKGFHLPDRVQIHDITLRDGEQQAGIIFRKEEKLEIARALDEAGVDRIEAGMPAVSKQDMAAIKAITHEGLSAKIFAFSRCAKSDIDLARQCDVDGVITEIPSSDHILEYAYGWSQEHAIQLSVEATSYAAEHGLHVAFFTIDATRASFETCWKLVNAVASEGHMDSLVMVDTFGVCSPEAIRYFVTRMKERIKKPIEIHCHNDFGLAVANTLAAVTAGVEIVHTTVNAIGERVGNGSLDEIALALEMLYGVKTGIRKERLYDLSKVVERLSEIDMPPNKPVVGDNAFTTESGIVAGWWNRLEQLNMPLEMFPFKPELVGQRPVRVVMGKKSGKDSIAYKARHLGLHIPDDKVEPLLTRVKETSEQKKRVLTDEEFKLIVREICH
ncbi:pyruvate carboxyltransferase [Candidatus Bathyarchaeota archaeon]|nr:pyruvate carboxyltransferase [Candidatus Bathyarchaeota archaeon]